MGRLDADFLDTDHSGYVDWSWVSRLNYDDLQSVLKVLKDGSLQAQVEKQLTRFPPRIKYNDHTYLVQSGPSEYDVYWLDDFIGSVVTNKEGRWLAIPGYADYTFGDWHRRSLAIKRLIRFEEEVI